MNLLEASIDSYKQSCQDFVARYTEYVENHLKVVGIGSVEFKPSDLEKPFKYLSDVLHWGVVIYDTINKSKLTDKDKKYMSGVKFIDNMTKHQADYASLDLWEFIRPSLNLNSKINLIPGNKINATLDVNLNLIFQDISKINVIPLLENQKRNYMWFVCGKNVNEIISNMEEIIKKHINIGTYPE